MRFVKSVLMMVLALAAVSNAQPTKKPKPKSAPEANVHYYGAVDLGSKGTKASLYSFVTDVEGKSPKVVFSKVRNTKLVSSMVDGKFTPDGIADAADAVKEVVDAMKAFAAQKNYSVDVYYVNGSSGVAKGINKDDLKAAVKAKTGIQMDFVSAAEEGYYGMLSAVPRSQRANSMYIDIGSGNAKLGCIVGDVDLKNFRSAEIPYGSVSGRNEALKRNPKDVNAGVASVMSDVADSYDKQSRDIPCLRNRPVIYWTGGAAWATATFTHPEKSLDGWVTITRRDLDKFVAQLQDGTWNQKKPAFPFSKTVPTDKNEAAAKAAREKAIREQAISDRADVQNVFVREDLLSGVSIMQAVLKASNPSASIHFVRTGNFIYGYALEKFRADNPRPTN